MLAINLRIDASTITRIVVTRTRWFDIIELKSVGFLQPIRYGGERRLSVVNISEISAVESDTQVFYLLFGWILRWHEGFLIGLYSG